MPDTHVTITGNLTDDPELTLHPQRRRRWPTSAWPSPPASRTARAGATATPAFFRINVWRQLAEHVGDSLSKGDRVMVIGRLQARSWETPEGERRIVVEVEADEVGPSLRWATAKPERATNGKPRARASSTTTRRSEPRQQ